MLSEQSAQKKKEEGNRHAAQGAFEAALQCYEAAIRLNPHIKEVWLNKGLMHHNLEQFTEATTAFEQALIIDPGYQKAKDNHRMIQARIDMQAGRYQEAYTQLKLLPQTARVERLCLQAINQFKAMVLFCRVDLKLTAENRVKILSMGHGMSSALQSNITVKLSEALSSFRLPFTITDKPGKPIIDRCSEVQEFINQHRIIGNSGADLSRISDFSGVYCSQTHESSLPPNILSLHDSIPAETVFDEKVLTDHLFGDSPFRPARMTIPHRYSADLASKIIQAIPSAMYVIKRSDLDKCHGVWLARRDQLDEVLSFLLKANPTEAVKAYTEHLRRCNVQPQDFQFHLSLLLNWYSSFGTVSLVEAYYPSKFLSIQGKMYDPTMRVSFIMVRDNGTIRFKPLGAYWQLPKTAIASGNSYLSRIATLGYQDETTQIVDVSPDDLACVYEQLSTCLPPVFHTLLTFDLFSYRQTLLTSGSPEKRTYAGDVGVHMVNALGRCGYQHAALELLDEAAASYSHPYKVYHERGLVYHHSRSYREAIDQFTLSIAASQNCGAYFRRGLTHYAMGNIQEACKDLATACEGTNDVHYRNCYEQVKRELRDTMTARSSPHVIPGGKKSIDLHGCSVQESKRLVQAALENAKEEQLASLTIVTGLGHHLNRDGSRGVLHQALPKWLKKMPDTSGIKSIVPDMGAYDVEFNFNDSLKEKAEAMKKEFVEFLGPALANDIEALGTKANTGDPNSQLRLGVALLEGIYPGLAKDPDRGLQLLNQAAEQNHAEAQFLLGDMAYRNRNYKNARHWLTKALQLRHLDAAFFLGSMYWLGQGVIRDAKKGIHYLTLAAKNPTITPITVAAAHSLADIYYTGDDAMPCDFTQAFEYSLLAAKHDCTPAKVKLAKCYFYGRGTPPDDVKAFHWFKQAALAGNPIAEYYTGYCYECGKGVQADPAMASHWFQKSARSGDLDAQFKLAYALLVDKTSAQLGIERLEPLAAKAHPASLFALGQHLLSKDATSDIPKAISLLRRAAELKEPHTPACLALHYLSGNLCPVDHAQAVHWANELVSWGEASPAEFCGVAVGLIVTAGDESVFPPIAIECLKRAAHLKFAHAQYLLASHTLLDERPPTDLSETLFNLEQAAQQNHHLAQLELAKLYGGRGNYLPRDPQKCFHYMQQAAVDEELLDAQIGLGLCYLEGLGVDKNRPKALECFEKAAQLKDANAQYQLGQFLLQDTNIERAIHYLTLAAQQDHLNAQVCLGQTLLSSGNQRGVYWLHRAALKGHQPSQRFFQMSNANGFKDIIEREIAAQSQQATP